MRLSKHTLSIDEDGQVHLVSLLTRAVLQIDRSEWLNISKGLGANIWDKLDISDRLRNELTRSLFVVEDDFDEHSYVSYRSLTSRSISDTFGLVVVPTLACNMNCHYCFEDKSDASEITSENIEALSKFVKEQISDERIKHLHVRWFGGEPLNNVNLIERVMNRLISTCREINRDISSDIVTNGYNLTGEVANTLSSLRLNSAQITFEGEQRLHDKIRRVSKTGSYKRLIENIISSAKYLDVRIRIHVAPYNVESISILLEDLACNGIHELSKYIYFAPLFNYKQNRKDKAFFQGPKLFLSAKDFSKYQVNLSKKALSLGFKIADPLDTDYSVCTALREYTAVVNPNGTLAKCYMDAGDESEAYGNLMTGITNDQNLKKWRRMHFAEDPECRSCRFAPVCLGGCAKEVMSSADKELLCTPLRYNFRELIPIIYQDKDESRQCAERPQIKS